ncbi:MAG: hypothetical protein U9Q82_12460 [Chloroflexota bacterium]|nr:hypothetical protein [Chloroflexota bacterium]
MPTTIEATIDKKGSVLLQAPIRLPEMRRALVIILEEEPAFSIPETALLSEPVLSADWNRPEEDEAWLHLQHEQLS